ncbi:helix-turn-helix domain-containing protein [Salinigranum marinum]|uniref:helix-turn-helix domain-containing protein n=1 Tax=Salinigranum marinum TaxID=1515595 RepID=UPI002989FE04|nr:helix-turn-helix domain-containing protein [Salinigranum marinum]
MLRAKLYLDMETDCILSQVTSRWDTAFTVNYEEVIDDEHIKFVIDAGDNVDEFVRLFEASEQVRTVDRVGETHVKLTKRSCGALPIIRNNHGMMQWWDRVNGTERIFDIVVYRRDDLRNIVRELREFGSVEVMQLLPYKSSETLLSDRQTEVVTLALTEGYYEWPRAADAETLAAELDIAHSTFLEHLRKAEAQLLASALEGEQRSGTNGDGGLRTSSSLES